MITFDRQAGPLQNFNRSHVMVIGRSVSFSDPARPSGPQGAWGAPNTPKSPPPEKNFFFCMRFRTPGTFLKKKFSRGKKTFRPPPPKFFVCLFVLRPQEHFLADIFFPVKNFTSIPPPPSPPPPPHLHAPAQSSEHSPQSSCNNK